jgi:hypothetical protein
MPRWQRVSLTACAAVIAYALTYAGADYAKVPRLFHHQVEHELRLESLGPGLASGYLGLWLWALGAAVVVAAATWLVAGRRKTPVSARTLTLAAAWAGTAVAIAIGYYVWSNLA